MKSITTGSPVVMNFSDDIISKFMTCLHGIGDYASCLGSHSYASLSQMVQLEKKTCLQQIRNYCTVCAKVLEPILLLCWSFPRNRIVMKALLKVIKG